MMWPRREVFSKNMLRLRHRLVPNVERREHIMKRLESLAGSLRTLTETALERIFREMIKLGKIAKVTDKNDIEVLAIFMRNSVRSKERIRATS